MPIYGPGGRDISADLDNWITGHYGEDDPANQDEPDELSPEEERERSIYAKNLQDEAMQKAYQEDAEPPEPWTCPNCLEENEGERIECKKCGDPRPDEFEREEDCQ